MWLIFLLIFLPLIGLLVSLLAKGRNVTVRMICPACGQPVQTDHLTCPHCGLGLQEKCPACGANVRRVWKVCPACGINLGVKDEA